MDRLAGRRGPGVAHRRRQRLARAEPVAQMREARRQIDARVEHLAVDARRGGEQRRAMRPGQPRPHRAIGRAGIDQRGRSDRPGVGQPGAERVGPVEGARMQNAVLRRQAVPALPHHPPRPGGALRMDDALRPPARAGRVDDVGRIVGRGRRAAAGRVVVIAQRRDLGRAEHRRARPGGKIEARPQRDQPWLQIVKDACDLGRGQQRRSRDRHGAERVGREEQHGEVDAVAEPEQDAVPAPQAGGAQSAGAAQDRVRERAVGPALGDDAGRRQHLERDLVRRPFRGRQRVRRHVEARRRRGKRPVIEDRRLGHRGVLRGAQAAPK